MTARRPIFVREAIAITLARDTTTRNDVTGCYVVRKCATALLSVQGSSEVQPRTQTAQRVMVGKDYTPQKADCKTSMGANKS